MLQPFYGLDAPSRAGKPTPAATCHRELNPSYLLPVFGNRPVSPGGWVGGGVSSGGM
jgi:hypothetical protein